MTTLTTRNAPLVPAQASTDEQVIDLWLHGRPHHTYRAYLRDVLQFMAWTQKPLGQVTVADLQGWSDRWTENAKSTQARKTTSIKSLLTFAHRVGYIAFNPGVAVRCPKAPTNLNARILTESEVHRILGRARAGRDRTMLLVLYASGARISELCGLRWDDVEPRDAGGQITLRGKGEKIRSVLLSPATYAEILALEPEEKTGRVFGICPSTVRRFLKKATQKAGISKAVSPHWFRHAHVSHALDRGVPIHLVKDTVGHGSIATTGRYAHARPTDSSALHLGV